MRDDSDDVHAETEVFLAWGMPMEARDSLLDEPTLWLTAGVTLLLWTGLALLLTAA
jgi:hypothetical protein